jgi:hypothetical protein
VSARIVSLSDILDSRRWMRYSDPFPHVVARDVFVQSFYRELEDAFRAALSRGLGQPGEKARFTRNMPGYDAYGLVLDRRIAGPLGVFISRPWHDVLASLFGLNATGDVQCALHHHPPGSASGWVHNDLGLRWFMGDPKPGEVNLDCSGRTPAAARRAGLNPRPVVRAIAMLFYLNNGPWSPGRGGETGLYRTNRDPVNQPAAVVPPVNNSVLVFECTPYSFHTFLKNRRNPRDSVNLWLHRPRREVVVRWGESKIVDVARA